MVLNFFTWLASSNHHSNPLVLTIHKLSWTSRYEHSLFKRDYGKLILDGSGNMKNDYSFIKSDATLSLKSE